MSSETLDQLAARIGLTSIAFLKINIEGAERLAIQGAGQLVSRLGAACICCHDFRAGPAADDWFRTRELVISWLEVNGFQVYTRDDHPRD